MYGKSPWVLGAHVLILVWEELKNCKLNISNVAAVWLDIANAYGSVPHQLIFKALERYGIHPN